MSSSVAADPESRFHGPVLEARALHLWRGEQHLLRNLSFELRAGELLQIVGPNGIGKSSLLRVIVGLLPAESGEVRWHGQDALRDREAFSSQLAYLGHTNALKNDLTALENLYFSLRLTRAIDRDACFGRLEALGVAHCAALPVRVLSAGQRRRVAMARLSLSQASLWVLDEPVTNLDLAGTQRVEQLIREHLQGGGAVIAASHLQLLQGDARARSLALN